MSSQYNYLRFNDFSIDLDAAQITRNGSAVEVEPQVFDVIALLATNPGRLIGHDELIEKVWRGRIVSDSAIASRINAARKALGDDGTAQRVIKTVRGRGFRFELTPAVANSDGARVAAPATATGESAVREQAIAAEPSAGESPKPLAAFPDRPSIAVLPFTNMGADPEQEYFADGLTDDLITALSRWRSFPVVARNSTFTFKGKPVGTREAARALGAHYVVEGSIRKAGTRVRVIVQLADGSTGNQIWADRFDRHLVDIFEVQDELTHRITAIIAPELNRVEQKRIAVSRPATMDAWEHYLRGDAALSRETPEAAAGARAHFEKAAELDPNYSDAYTGIARSFTNVLRMDAATDREETLRRAMSAAKRAVELDPLSSRAHFALSTVYILQNEHALSLAEARLAVDLNPSDSVALHALGNKSDLAGDPEGIGRMEVAQRLDPLDPTTAMRQALLARAYARSGNYPAAIATAHSAIFKQPDNGPAQFMLAIALALADRVEEAAAAIRRCETVAPGLVARRANWRPYTDEASNVVLRNGLREAMLAARAP